MIELSEAIPFSKIANDQIKGLKIINAEVLKSPHKFAWINDNSENFRSRFINRIVKNVTSSAHYVRFIFDNLEELAIAEDVNFKYKPTIDCDDKHQLKLDFSNGYSLVFQVKLYGFFLLGTKEDLVSSQPYYKKAVEAISPLDDQFTYEYFKDSTFIDLKKGSIKQALATEQHIPGLGNGLLQDVLFDAKMSPKKKIATMTEEEKVVIYHSVKNKVNEIVNKGGRDIQVNMFGQPGHYETLMTSSRTYCPLCNQTLIKEPYLGGKVIYCSNCQKE